MTAGWIMESVNMFRGKWCQWRGYSGACTFFFTNRQLVTTSVLRRLSVVTSSGTKYRHWLRIYTSFCTLSARARTHTRTHARTHSAACPTCHCSMLQRVHRFVSRSCPSTNRRMCDAMHCQWMRHAGVSLELLLLVLHTGFNLNRDEIDTVIKAPSNSNNVVNKSF
jgi:hypothetical protein